MSFFDTYNNNLNQEDKIKIIVSKIKDLISSSYGQLITTQQQAIDLIFNDTSIEYTSILNYLGDDFLKLNQLNKLVSDFLINISALDGFTYVPIKTPLDVSNIIEETTTNTTTSMPTQITKITSILPDGNHVSSITTEDGTGMHTIVTTPDGVVVSDNIYPIITNNGIPEIGYMPPVPISVPPLTSDNAIIVDSAIAPSTIDTTPIPVDTTTPSPIVTLDTPIPTAVTTPNPMVS